MFVESLARRPDMWVVAHGDDGREVECLAQPRRDPGEGGELASAIFTGNDAVINFGAVAARLPVSRTGSNKPDLGSGQRLPLC